MNDIAKTTQSETVVKPTAPKPAKPAAAIKPASPAKVPETAKPAQSEKVEGKVETKPERASSRPGPDFNTLTDTAELVECYNEMTLTAKDLGLKTVTVKSFADVKTGVLACERLHANIVTKREESAVVKKTVKTRTAVKGKTTKAKAAKTTKATARRSRLDHKARIVWIGKGKEALNPFREGSGKWTKVEQVRKASGRVVESALKSGVEQEWITRCVGPYKLAKLEGAA